jgi:CRISPR-associated endonuclease/helicase Cas3
MRPYHAGLLGADTLVVLDEAHLVPPFERLLGAIAKGQETFGPRCDADRGLVPAFQLLPLSATARTADVSAFRLQKEDLRDRIVAKRLGAAKRLTIDGVENNRLADRLANEAWALTARGTVPIRCVVYCDRRDDAETVKARLDELVSGRKGGSVSADTELFVGARRVREREVAKNWLQRHGFLAGSDAVRERPAILVATSAGEVGVDLDADHMVCDLVPWERMVQRLGRSTGVDSATIPRCM